MAFNPETGDITEDSTGLADMLSKAAGMLNGNDGIFGEDADRFGQAFDALGTKGRYNGRVIDGKLYATGRGENINVTARTMQAVDFFQTKDGGGWTREQSIGIVANLVKESGLKTDIAGDFDTGGSYGLAQWHADRRAVYAKVFGHRMDDPSLTSEQRFTEQLKFVDYELHHSEHVAGDALRYTTSAGEAAATFTAKYERPKYVEHDMAVRAAAARGLEIKLGKETLASMPTGDPKNMQHAIIKNEVAQTVNSGSPAALVAVNDDTPKPSAGKLPDEKEKQEAAKKSATGKPAQKAQVAANAAAFPVPTPFGLPT